jgi:hypothetical protein
MIEFILIALLLIWNFGVSIWNAYAVGSSWARVEANGGTFGKLMLWSGWIMSAIGFTWTYLFIIGYVLYAFGKVDQEAINAMFSLGYLIIVIPALGSGLLITLNSWRIALQERSMGNTAVAMYNTSAQFYNSYRALSAIPEALESTVKFFAEIGAESKGNSKSKGQMIIIAAIIFAIVMGILTTHYISNWAAKRADKNHVAEED